MVINVFTIVVGLVFSDILLADVFVNQWAVQIRGDIEDAKFIAKKHGFEFVAQIMPNYYLFKHGRIQRRSTVPSRQAYMSRLLREPKISWIEQQVVKKRVKRDVFSDFNDPKWPRMWYLNRGKGLDMNILPAWRKGYTGQGVVVTILDDGLEKDHPDIKRNYDSNASFDVNDQDPDPQPRYDILNENRHGTRCAGVVAAEADNSICCIGVAHDAKIGGVRMLDGDVTDAVEGQSLGLYQNYISIYSASWGPDDDGQTVDGPGIVAQEAFINGISFGRNGLGSIFVWASGNGGRDGDSCNCDGYTNSIYTLSINSASENGQVPWYSEACSSTLASTYSSGSAVERQIITTDLRKGCAENHTGTSASAPLAAAICALALQASPYLTWRDMQHVVVLTSKSANLEADDWVTNGVGRKVSHHFGYGLLDASAIVDLARNWTNVPPQRRCEIQYQSPDGRALQVNGKLELTISSDGCRGTLNRVTYLEHVQAYITLSASNRGQIQIFLTSPLGTRSTLLPRREKDTSSEGFSNWAFMTTHCWGETSVGIWRLEIMNGKSICTLKNWTLLMYGTSVPVPGRRDQPTLNQTLRGDSRPLRHSLYNRTSLLSHSLQLFIILFIFALHPSLVFYHSSPAVYHLSTLI